MFKVWGDCVKGNVATFDCIPVIFSNVVNALLMFGGIFALFIFLYGGFRFMNSGGDSKKLEGARETLVYGALGLSLVLLSFFVINIISHVTGANCIKKFGFGC